MKRNINVAYLFVAPWALGFAIFMGYPLLASLYFSFTSYNVLKSPRWVGLANYTELAQDEVFHVTLKNTLIFVCSTVPLSTIVAIGMALLLNTKVRGMAIYRTLFYVPCLVPNVALGVLWLWVFNGEYGLLNEAIRKIGVAPPNWLGDPFWAKVTLVIIAMWGAGNAMVIYLAGLQDVPVSLYEAAELDGAKSWMKLKAVTLPMISPVILFNVIMGIIGALQVFALPYVMFPAGAPARSTYFFTSYLFDNAFQYQRMGYASAMGWIMFFITLALTLVSIKLSNKHVHYDRS